MHEINTDYCKVVIEDRRKMATEFFYKRHISQLQRKLDFAHSYSITQGLYEGVKVGTRNF